MSFHDSVGHAVSGANAEGMACFETACRQMRCYVGDPVASLDRAIAAAPGMVMAHALKAWAHLLGTEPAGPAVALQCLAACEALDADARERGHLAAIRALASHRWSEASRLLHDLSLAWPLDAIALQAGHQVDFFRGDARMLRDRIAHALPAWSDAVPGHHAVLGMMAFGLEECGDYRAAERFGRACVEREPRDGWGWHAVAHVMEMENRADEGVAWLRGGVEQWAPESFFAIHNWWHLALFHLERGETGAALELFDGPVHGARSTVVIDMIDAAALLWRLELQGVDVGARWESVADGWAGAAGTGLYAFNEWHAMMAFVGARRVDAQAAVRRAVEAAAVEGPGDARVFAREVGVEAASAIEAFGRGQWTEAASALRRVRGHASRFGGSHAQRDLIDLSLIEAALRGGMAPLARALVAERAARRPRSVAVRALERRAAALSSN